MAAQNDIANHEFHDGVDHPDGLDLVWGPFATAGRRRANACHGPHMAREDIPKSAMVSRTGPETEHEVVRDAVRLPGLAELGWR
jgi:hypothetical protein